MGLRNFISRLFSKKETTFPNPSDVSLHALLTQAADEYHAGHSEKAETLFLQALGEATSDSSESLVEYNLHFLQFLWLQNEAHPKAIKCLSDFIAKFKDSSSAYRCRATVYWYSGHPSEASADFSEVLRLLSDDVASLIGRGQILVELGKPGEAHEDLGRALQLLNKVPNARDRIWASSQAYTRNGMGAAWTAMGDFPRAMEEFDLSIAMRPENAWVYFNRAETFKKTKQFRESLQDYRKALRAVDPKLPAYKIVSAEKEIQALERTLAQTLGH
jgi:tetratricopeptide (TPR) repeat protein